MSGYWEGKDPCWKVLGCSKYVYPKCPAHLFPERPCWENAYTQSEILLGIGRDCRSCKVFRLYHQPPRSPSPFRMEGIPEGKPD